MGYSKLNLASIKNKALDSKKAKAAALSKAEKRVEVEKNKLITAFETHPVTIEIQNGPNANNISGTLSGYGNLFSFIGFPSSSDPISPIKNLLQTIKVKNIKRKKSGFDVTVKYPSQNEIKSESSLPFEIGKSWVEGIERGISGFTAYIFKTFLSGRSGTGLQSEYTVRSGFFKKRNYLFSMLSTFNKNIRGGKNDYSV